MTIGGEAAGRVSEDLVWERLEASRRPDDLIWRNQRVTSDDRNSEIDFLLGLPNSGFVALEVKGGIVTVAGEAWIQRSRSGRRRRINPMKQAREGMYGLREYVESDPRWADRGRVRWGHGVVVPFSDVAADFALPDCPRHMIFGQGDLEHLVPKLARITDRQVRDRPPTKVDVELVREILLGRGHPRMTPGWDDADEDMGGGPLTDQQRSILQVARVVNRLEVRGGPGSGKTRLALEHVRTLCAQGDRVALLGPAGQSTEDLVRATELWPAWLQPAFVGSVADLVQGRAESRSGGWYDAVVVDDAHAAPSAWWPHIRTVMRDPDLGHLLVLVDATRRSAVREPEPQIPVVLVLEMSAGCSPRAPSSGASEH